jgi:protein SCO1
MNRRDVLTKGVLAGPLALAVFGQDSHGRATGSLRGPRADYFPNFILRTQDNKPVRFYDDLVQGKIVIFNFFYARCEETCPATMANLARVQELLGGRVRFDYHMYSITLDSGHDTPRVLKEFARMYGAKPRWLFLTGKQHEIELLRHKLGYADPDPVRDKDKSRHLGVIRYGNEAMDRWAACPVEMNPERIAESIYWMDFPKSWPGKAKT